MAKINKALLSVSDKSSIVDFAKELAAYNIQFISTGGTARILRENGLELMEVSDYTGYPELLDGRVKTLHPKIHGGILGVRKNPDHRREMDEFNIEQIDMIVVNVKPFDYSRNDPNPSPLDVMNKIDTGGIALLRSAAKNFENVTVIVDAGDYDMVLDDLRNNDGAVSVETNLQLATKVFQSTSLYDRSISEYMQQMAEKRIAGKKIL